MEVFYGFVKRLVEGFESAGLDYAFTGALAVSFYSVPRTTVDVVVYVPEEKYKEKLLAALKGAGLIADEREIVRAFESSYRIASFRDASTPYSVDVIFSERRFERKAGTVAGLRTFFQTPEDLVLVLAKLRMIRATVPKERALKDVEDVKAILRFSRVDLDVVKERARMENTLSILEDIMEL